MQCHVALCQGGCFSTTGRWQMSKPSKPSTLRTHHPTRQPPVTTRSQHNTAPFKPFDSDTWHVNAADSTSLATGACRYKYTAASGAHSTQHQRLVIPTLAVPHAASDDRCMTDAHQRAWPGARAHAAGLARRQGTRSGPGPAPGHTQRARRMPPAPVQQLPSMRVWCAMLWHLNRVLQQPQSCSAATTQETGSG
jgi:hypothetical protein